MNHEPAKNNHWHPAPCRGAQRLLIIAISATLLVGFAMAADLLLRAAHQDNSAGAWMNALTLSAPALWTAGAPMRHPETVNAGIDLRFCAGVEISP